MIAMLKGIVWGIDSERIILDVNGVGYQLYVPLGCLKDLCQGEKRTFHTYLIVREDDMTLYGFNNPDEKKLFTLLLGVKGIGPKAALSVLSTFSPNQVKQAILAEDVSFLTIIPGIGGKTAKRLILELKEKIADQEFLGEDVEDVKPYLPFNSETLEILVNLGFSRQEARNALNKISLDHCETVEKQIKEALKILARDK
ncbi:MAG: Holliday junction branch migration protein RuvA [Peptococcaceae bacterium]|jgi:Holliday junction DNA helicase RuvA|nr:Holliday junction branch migration protein RuvA [Peptococcaceae bacterium]